MNLHSSREDRVIVDVCGQHSVLLESALIKTKYSTDTNVVLTSSKNDASAHILTIELGLSLNVLVAELVLGTPVSEPK